MSRVLVASNLDHASKTTPTGIVTKDSAWSLLIIAKFQALPAGGGCILVRLGPAAGNFNLRGFYVRFVSGKIELTTPNGNEFLGTTTFTTGVEYRILVTSTAGRQFTASVNGTQEGQHTGNTWTELQAGDVFQIGDSDSGGSGAVNPDVTFSGVAWLQGVTLSGAAGENYMAQTGGKTWCSLKTDYGPSGVIMANAMKHCSMQENANPSVDISTVGNDLTMAGTVGIPAYASPLDSIPESCSIDPADGIPDLMHTTGFPVQLARL